LLAVLVSTACGGATTLTTKDLQTQAGSVESFAAEGALVAQGVQQGRTTETFVRVHTEYMAKAVEKVSSTLASARASGGLDEKRKQAVRLASLVTDEIDRLHRAPGDRTSAAGVKSKLEHLAVEAGNLAK
jgi:hypothetical protein